MPLGRVFALLVVLGRIAAGLVVGTSPGRIQLSGSFGTHANLSLLQRTEAWIAGDENPLPPFLKSYEREFLGEGSYGQVYGIVSRCGRGNLAVKVIKEYDIDIENEAKAMKFLSDTGEPFFLKFYNLGFFPYNEGAAAKTKEAAYMIMESAGSKGLLESIISHYENEKGHPSKLELLTVFVDVAKAVAVMHKNHMYHRDIKPANILVIDGHGVLIDYGFACADPLSITKLKMCDKDSAGTLAYLPPECRECGSQLTSCSREPQSLDVFALGVTLLNVVVGQFPELSDETSDCRPYDISKDATLQRYCLRCLFTKRVPTRLRSLMQNMLSSDPSRQPTAAEVANEVNEYMMSKFKGKLPSQRRTQASSKAVPLCRW